MYLFIYLFVVYLMTMTVDHRELNDRLNNELERIWKEMVVF
jgi:hypothetical protein